MKTIHRNIIIAVLFVCGILASLAAAVPPPSDFNTDRILDAIRQVETGGCKNPSEAVGDGGKAIGPFQIHLGYWKDAVAFDKSLGGTYNDCRKPEYARRVVRAYLTRYGRGKTNEEMARIHNGGPRGHRKSATLEYWERVKREIE
jgi:hypothetical protein